MTDQIVDRPLLDVVFDAIDADADLGDAAKYLVMAALESDDALSGLLDGVSTPAPRNHGGTAAEEPVGAYLTSISVSGFRGIGPKAVLELHPAPGITIVSGRNGSGKSSFAEALEYAVTGKSYRWENKAKLWKDTWRNLHLSSPCEVRVGLTVEGSETTVVGVDWPAGANLTDSVTWTQTGKARRSSGTDELGWKSAVELHRPILSYDEIGGLIEDSPSTLYDALAKLLGLEDIAEAEKRLGAALKSARMPRASATGELRELKRTVAESGDDRATVAGMLLKKRTADLDAVLALATGADATVSPSLAGLRSLTTLRVPDSTDVARVLQNLRTAVSESVDLASEALSIAERRNDLLAAALRLHEETGTTQCPVCTTGTLDDAWAEQSRTQLADENNKLDRYKRSRRALEAARRAAIDVIGELVEARPVDGVELTTFEAYRDAVEAARNVPAGSGELADHVAEQITLVAYAADSLRTEAAAALATREDTWAPIAGRLAAWVHLESEARATDDDVENLDAAKKWISSHATALRNQRLEPIAEQAREIWYELRQESNVDIGSISLQGSNTRRKAVLTGSVDGVQSEALSVMSQGELHALALALFIPRATTPNSPFRFIVLDDPIQAMDPAKIDGFIRVLSRLAKSRQVVVFSHDDRLATAIRQLAVDARLVQVTREAGSKITTAETLNQAMRYVMDVEALVLDENVPDVVKRRAAPGLFRLALEAAAQQVFYASQHRAGMSRSTTEQLWGEVKTTRRKLALAAHGDSEVDLNGWLAQRKERWPTLKIANAGSHGADVHVDRFTVKELGKMVDGILTA